MPKRWETRAALGASLLLVLLPLLTLTGTNLGVQLPKWVLQGALGLEVVGLVFAALLIVLPHRAWQLGRRQSDVRHGLASGHTNVQINPKTDIYAFELDINNQTDQALNCRFEEFKVVIRESGLTTSSPPFTVLVPKSGTKLRSPTVNLPKSDQISNAEITWTAVFGPANGKMEVRWKRSQVVSFVQDASKGQAGVIVSVPQPDSYELIKPFRLAKY
jgi:hypothetical protein